MTQHADSFQYNRGLLQLLESQDVNSILGLMVTIFIVYSINLAIYRFYFHPLARVPGPPLASITYWYEFYYDVVQQGRYIFKLQELHKTYGPILRVNPNEVHIADPDVYSEIYHNKPYKTNRDSYYFIDFLGESVAFTIDHNRHLQRRQSLVNYFSARSVRSLEDRIRNVMLSMQNRLQQALIARSIIDLRFLFTALAIDIVSEYSFGKSGSMDAMARPEFGKDWIDLTKGQIHLTPFARHYKIVMRMMMATPIWLAQKLVPAVAKFTKWQSEILNQIEESLEAYKSRPIGRIDQSEITILAELIADPNLPKSDKQPHRLKDEAIILMGAGAEVTAVTLSRTAFYVLSNPTVMRTLQEELRSAIPNAREVPTITNTSDLPYLNAVIEEGLRVSHPVIGRNPRVFQDHAFTYKNYRIPPGYAISQSPYTISTNPDIFPDPFTFDPTRWLKKDTGLQNYQITFSKGRRMCLGINLAYAELRLGLASLFRRFELELYKTDIRDVTVQHDLTIAFPAMDSKGIRVRVVGELD